MALKALIGFGMEMLVRLRPNAFRPMTIHAGGS
jgi:hypothetical protein